MAPRPGHHLLHGQGAVPQVEVGEAARVLGAHGRALEGAHAQVDADDRRGNVKEQVLFKKKPYFSKRSLGNLTLLRPS